MIKKILSILIIVICALVIIFVIYFELTLNKKGTGEEQDFVVKEGQTTSEIANNLKTNGLITSPFVFTYYARIKNSMIQVGTFRVSPAQNIKEIVKILSSKSSQDLITIPEGWRVTQIDDFLAEKNIITKGAFTKVASSDEGYLFPDTYRFLPNTKPEDIRQEMIANFNKKTFGMKVTRETVILASIVEREAKFDEDRPKIAGVYLNRLEKQMKLEADPTIQYAKGSWGAITVADYRSVISPYNTYTNIGLPPGPICNPGLKSIEAVLYPEKNGYMYFFHKEDGHAVFSSTLQEHEENLKSN